LNWILSVLVRVWVHTLRLTLEVDPSWEARERERARIYAFLHGKQLPLLRFPRPKATAALVSHSRDGERQAFMLKRFGLHIRRGSSSRGASSGLRSLLRVLRGGTDIALAVDGPKGPVGIAKQGPVWLAKYGNAVLAPLGSASSCAWTFSRAWDGFTLPLPFTRIAVVLGAPPAEGATAEELTRAIEKANARAEVLLQR
jgi:lysophospholipid acyltransferase (LPLAT)-like uncharacterized protein